MSETAEAILERNATKTKAKPQGKKHPNRGKKHRCLGNGEGDYVIVQVSMGHATIPDFAMVAVPGETKERPFLQFSSTVEAMKWLRNDKSERMLTGKFAVIKFCELGDLGVTEVVQRRTMTLKAKIQVSGPTGESEDE